MNLTKHSNMDNSTIQYYNTNAKDYFENTVNLDLTQFYDPFLELIPEQGKKILDAGCGSGRDSLFFKKKGFEIIAFDASEELVKLSSDLLKQPVLHMTFEDLSFSNEFDGIWTCASLLHVPKDQMPAVLKKLADALKENGILYASFKYGNGEYVNKGRLFTSYDKASFEKLVSRKPNLKVVKMWLTEDVRPDRAGEMWLNVLLKKIST